MPKGKKSSLDLEEPVVVQGVAEESVAEDSAIEEKADLSAEKKNSKAEEKKKRSVLICVM